MQNPELTQDQLKQYIKGWRKIRGKLYKELLASYTPEQQEIVKRMNRAAAQAALCVKRLHTSNFSTTLHTSRFSFKFHRIFSCPADPAQE